MRQRWNGRPFLFSMTTFSGVRTQISAAHTRADVEFALEKFVEARKELEAYTRLHPTP
jgi:hypothetical protein